MRAPTYKVAVTIVYILGLFVQILDATIVNVALPSLADEFGVPATDVEWVVVGYILTLAAAIPAAGWLADRLGSKRIFLGAIAVFTVASVLCGSADTLDQLVAFRLLQGLGAGLITPIGAAILFRAYPPAERAKAAAAVIGVAVVAPALGPVLGGLIVDTISWRWIFFVNIPIGVLAFVLGRLWLRENTEPGAGSFDAAGFVLAGGGLAMLLYALSVAPEHGWSSVSTLAPGLGATGAFTALVLVELRRREPLLDLRLFSEPLFRACNVAGLFTYAGFLSQIFLFTLFIQDLRGSSALSAGLTQSPQAVGIFVVSTVAGSRAYQAIGPRRMMMAGGGGAAAVTAALALVTLTTPLWVLGTMMFARGMAMGLVFVAIQTAAYARMSQADMAQATTLFSTQRQAASAIGVAVAASVLAALAPDVAGPTPEGLDAYRVCFVVSAAMFVPGIVASSRIDDSLAAATRQAAPSAA